VRVLFHLASPPGAQDMIVTKLIKLFHSHAQSQEVRRQLRAFYVAIGVGIVVALLVAGILYWLQYSDRFRV